MQSRRSQHPRAARALGALCLALAALPAPLPGQDDQGIYSLPRSQDDVAELDKARGEIESGQFAEAVERLHRLYRGARHGVVPAGIDRHVGIRKAILDALRNLPETGRAEYQALAEREAGLLANRDPRRSNDREELRQWVARFPCSHQGVDAALRLGDLAIEEGAGVRAITWYRAAQDALPDARQKEQRITARLALANYVLRARRGEQDLDRGLDSELEQVVDADGRPGYWPAFGGHDGTQPMAEPLGSPRLLSQVELEAQGFESNWYPMHATGGLGGVFLNDGQRVICIDPMGGGDRSELVRWVAEGPMSDAPEVLWETQDAINSDMVLSCALSQDIVVASLQVPLELIGATSNDQFQGGIEIIKKLPARRLFAFDRSTGKRIWSHWDSAGGPISERFEGHEACAPPIIVDDTVYVPSHEQTGAIAYYLAAYDLYSGEERWRSLICTSQQEVNMFGNARQEFAAAPLAVESGVVYGCTNLGVCFAADAEDGELRWVRGYDVVPMPQTRLRRQANRNIYFANNPLAIADGVMTCTPLDSSSVLGVDTHSGRLLWSLPYNPRSNASEMIKWSLGVLGDEFIFAGKGIFAVPTRANNGASLRPNYRVLVSAEELEDDGSSYASRVPRGALTEDHVYYLSAGGTLSVFDRDGNRSPQGRRLSVDGSLGNLMLADGLITILHNDAGLSVFGDLEQMARSVEQRLRSDTPHPSDYLRLASLLSSGGPLSSGTARRVESLLLEGTELARAQGLGESSPIYRDLAEGLFRLAMNRAQEAPRRQALPLLREARARALRPQQWLEAQALILEVTEDDREQHLLELDRMVEAYGGERYGFRGYGRVPVQTYALWRSTGFAESPKDAVRRAQELIERHSEVQLGEATAGQLAGKLMARLIEQHGRGVYAAIEERAQTELATAAADETRLAALVERFPHSLAAEKASSTLLDLAVARGDLGAAANSYAAATARGAETAGLMRRMMLASRTRGNLPLAYSFARRLQARFGSQTSDLPQDGGKSFDEVVAALPPLPAREAPPYQMPLRRVGEISAPSPQVDLNFVQLQVIDGFATPDHLPLFAAVDLKSLRAFSTDPMPQRMADALYEIDLEESQEVPLYLCGSVLVVAEPQRVRGVESNTGRTLWSYPARSRRLLASLGLRDGVLHLYSYMHSAGDGGRLLGIEPLTGVTLFDREFPRSRSSVTPVADSDAIWALMAGGSTPPRIERIDPLTGNATETTPLVDEALGFLGIDSDEPYVFGDQNLQRFLFATADGVHLVRTGANRGRPGIVALETGSGAVRWRWQGTRGHRVEASGSYGTSVVVVERSRRSSRLTVLDRRGQERYHHDLEGAAWVTNWVTDGPVKTPAPDVLLIPEFRQGGQGHLTCYSIERGGPRFQHDLPGIRNIPPSPQLGEDFLMIPARMGRKDVLLYILDLERREAARPDGSPATRIDLRGSPLFVFRHDGYTVVDSGLANRIVIYGR